MRVLIFETPGQYHTKPGFSFMTTVYHRCCLAGFTDYVTSSRVGDRVAMKFLVAPIGERVRIQQTEPTGTFYVWAYPDDFIPFIDDTIREVNTAINNDLLKRQPLRQDRPKRKRIQR